MKKIFLCVKAKYIAILLVSSTLFSMLDMAICNQLALLPNSIMQGTTLSTLKSIALLCLFCIGIEWILDTTDELFYLDLYTDRSKYFLEHLYDIKPEILKKYNTGYISSLADSVIDKQYDVLHELLMEVPLTFGFVLYSAHTISKHSVTMFIAFMLLYIILASFRIIYSRIVMHKRNLTLQEYESSKVRYFIDVLSNISTIQRMGAKDFASTRLVAYGNRHYMKMRKTTQLNELSFIIFKYGCYAFIPVCILILYAQNSPALLNAEFVALCATIGIKCPHYGRAFYRLFRNYEKYKASAEKIETVLAEDNIREELSKEPFQLASIEDCDYSYTDTSNVSHRIKIPNFVVNRGDIICVHGESGQGKTTLLNILSKEIETSNVYPRTNTRINCSFVAQDTEMLDMELYENLTLGQRVKQERLIDMLDDVGLLPWFESLEHGFQTILGERGVFVSTGQRQRLNLIRGMLLDKDIYLLDEPTSNVDDETELKIVDFLARELKGKTAVIVTHRPAIMSICNRSYLFENGTLYEETKN